MKNIIHYKKTQYVLPYFFVNIESYTNVSSGHFRFSWQYQKVFIHLVS